MIAIVPYPPRYEFRVLPITARREDAIYGVFDTFAQEFLEGPLLKLAALRQVMARNRAYISGERS